jgi:hypothetical protein
MELTVTPRRLHNPEADKIQEQIRGKYEQFGQVMGRYPRVCFLPIEMHKILQAGTRDANGIPDAICCIIKLYEEDIDHGELNVIVWDGPLQLALDLPFVNHHGFPRHGGYIAEHHNKLFPRNKL